MIRYTFARTSFASDWFSVNVNNCFMKSTLNCNVSVVKIELCCDPLLSLAISVFGSLSSATTTNDMQIHCTRLIASRKSSSTFQLWSRSRISRLMQLIALRSWRWRESHVICHSWRSRAWACSTLVSPLWWMNEWHPANQKLKMKKKNRIKEYALNFLVNLIKFRWLIKAWRCQIKIWFYAVAGAAVAQYACVCVCAMFLVRVPGQAN